MAIQIDETLYRTLYDEALRLTGAMVPQVTQHALANDQDPAAAVGATIDTIFRRVLEGFEKQSAFLQAPNKRPAGMRPKPRIPFT